MSFQPEGAPATPGATPPRTTDRLTPPNSTSNSNSTRPTRAAASNATVYVGNDEDSDSDFADGPTLGGSGGGDAMEVEETLAPTASTTTTSSSTNATRTSKNPPRSTRTNLDGPSNARSSKGGASATRRERGNGAGPSNAGGSRGGGGGGMNTSFLGESGSSTVDKVLDKDYAGKLNFDPFLDQLLAEEKIQQEA